MEAQENGTWKSLVIDCNFKDVSDKFICDGQISLIRFIYKKGVPLYLDSLQIGDRVERFENICSSTLDYKYLLTGIYDFIPFESLKSVKKGDDFVFKQFNKPNSLLLDGTKIDSTKYNNMVEQIIIFIQ